MSLIDKLETWNQIRELDMKDIQAKLEEAVSDTSKSMLGLKNEYYRLKDIQADLKYELRKAKQTDNDKGLM